jgi:hypothetical protein
MLDAATREATRVLLDRRFFQQDRDHRGPRALRDTLMRVQAAYDIAQARKEAGKIRVRRYQPAGGDTPDRSNPCLFSGP